MGPDERHLRKRLREAGLAKRYINAAWPTWWTDAAEQSASARAELRFVLARSLGLNARALVDGDQVTFASALGARFKGLSVSDAAEHRAVLSFGQSVATLLGTATVAEAAPSISAERLRAFLLQNRTLPTFRSLIAVCWQLGIPVAYLDVTPLEAKRMHAMAVRHGARGIILIAIKDTLLAKAAFTLAHELGHIMLGHLADEPAYIDMEDPLSRTNRPPEEDAADQYALQLLTGRPQPIITTSVDDYTAAQLAQSARRTGATELIDPATIALCDGYRTGDWARSIAACQMIQRRGVDTAFEANTYAERQLDFDLLGEDGRTYLRRILGFADD